MASLVISSGVQLGDVWSRQAPGYKSRTRAYNYNGAGTMAPTAQSKAVAAAKNRSSNRAPKTNLFKAMTFNGPAPELINARLAMWGFVWASINEFRTGEMVLSQVQHISLWDATILLIWIYASMVPIMHSAKQEAFGVFSPRAELTNGRAAMIGFICLVALEYKVGVPFF